MARDPHLSIAMFGHSLRFALGAVLGGGALAIGGCAAPSAAGPPDAGSPERSTGPDADRPAPSVAIAFEVQNSLDLADGSITGTLALEPTAAGELDGHVAFAGPSGADLAGVVSATLDEGVLTVVPTITSIPGVGSVMRSRLVLSLEDTTGDGRLDTGEGTLDAQIKRSRGGDTVVTEGFYSPVRASPDAALRGARLVRGLSGFPGEGVQPDDPVEIILYEPVPYEILGGDDNPVDVVEVRADGERLDGNLTRSMSLPDGRWATRLKFNATGVIPFDSELSLAFGGLESMVGRPLEWDGEVLGAATDPGSILGNASFESGLDHWLTAGNVKTLGGRFEDVRPSDGTSQLVLEQDARMVGYLDVPDDGLRLEMTVTAYSRGPWPKRAIVATRRASGNELDTANFSSSSDAEPCDCDFYEERVGPLTHGVDLTGARGERVFVRIIADQTALVIDDLTLVRNSGL